MHVKWLRTALANLIAEADYVAKDNPTAADRFIDQVFAATKSLKRYPALGRPGRVTGTREFVISGTRYIVPYRMRNGTIEIIRVFHGARKWPGRF